MVYVHTILRDVAGLFKVGRLVAYHSAKVLAPGFTPTRHRQWANPALTYLAWVSIT